MDTGEGLVHLVAGDAVVLDEELDEDRLVEEATLLVVAAAVELLGVGEQLEAGFDEARAVGELVTGDLEPFGEVATLMLDLAESLLDLDLRQGVVCGEVDEVGLLGIQGVELCREVLLEQTSRGFLVGERFGDVGADVGDEPRAELDLRVVVRDGVLDADDVDMRSVAAAALLVDAEEVRVLTAPGVHDVLEDHPTADAFMVAAPAVERALEEVVVDAATLGGGGAGVEDVLDPAKQVVVNQSLVPALVLLALVSDEAEVVTVAQHEGELVERDLLGGAPLRGARPQAPVVELIGQVGQRVLVGGVELEGESDELGTFGVDGDGADLAAFGAVVDVEVAQGSEADGAAAPSLLPHLVADVSAGLARLVLVERREDAVHELTDRGVVDGLGGGDQGYTALPQIGHHDGVVVPVACHPGELVDDDVVHVLVLAYSGEHLLERHASGHLGCGAAGFEVLLHDCQAELVGLALAGDPLGGYGDALGVVVGVDLRCGRHP